MNTREWAAVACVVLVVLAAGRTAVKSEGNGRQSAGKEWSTVNGDLANSRFSTLSQINTQTVGHLAGAWISE